MKKYLTKITTPILLLSLSILPHAFAQEEGNFEVSNQSFKELFNKVRAATPKNVPWPGSYWPYKDNGIAIETIPISPAKAYDDFFRLGTKTQKWESENHSCDKLPDGDAEEKKIKKGCADWWGHCNAWSAAAIKEDEPRTSKRAGNSSFGVAEQKGLLTEIWMDSGSLFAGMTQKEEETGPWVNDPNSKLARKKVDRDTTYYDAFWDVTPRSFFLIFTNYVGLMRTGVVIDRFTGDQVWNQPIVGYRILPLRQADILRAVPQTDEESGKKMTVYPVFLRMKMYWANDGVPTDFAVSDRDKFAIERTHDESEEVETEFVTPDNAPDTYYEGRLLKFTLFFDAPVEVSSDGKTILTAGNIVGEGIWDHSQHPENYKNLDDTHPDFIWLPTELSGRPSEANPFVKASNVYKITGAPPEGDDQGGSGANSDDAVVTTGFTLTFGKRAILGASTPNNIKASIRSRLMRVLSRAELVPTISSKDVVISGNRVTVTGTLEGKVTRKSLTAAFEGSDYVPTSVDVNN